MIFFLIVRQFMRTFGKDRTPTTGELSQMKMVRCAVSSGLWICCRGRNFSSIYLNHCVIPFCLHNSFFRSLLFRRLPFANSCVKPLVAFCERTEFYTMKCHSALTFFSLQTICSRAFSAGAESAAPWK